MRKFKGTYAGNDNLVGNLAAKMRMRLLNEEGRFIQFSNRDSGMKNHFSKEHSYIPILDEKEKEAIANQVKLKQTAKRQKQMGYVCPKSAIDACASPPSPLPF